MQDISFMQDLLLPTLAACITVLLAVLAWLGSRLYEHVDAIPAELSRINETLHKIEIDLRRELSGHDSRITRVETKLSILEQERKQHEA